MAEKVKTEKELIELSFTRCPYCKNEETTERLNKLDRLDYKCFDDSIALMKCHFCECIWNFKKSDFDKAKNPLGN